MITTDSIREKIKEEIQNSGKTQTEIAKHIGVKQQQISCYLQKTKLPALDTLANLCAYLDIDANEILCIK